MDAVLTHRKLIDIDKDVFDILSCDAVRENISLKKYIENLLSSKAMELSRKTAGYSPAILRLMGSALPKSGQVEDIEDDRLKYILSK